MVVVKFHTPGVFCISGATGSGKTFWVFNLLKEKHSLFSDPPQRILYCYSIWQPIFHSMENDLGVVFHQGLPTSEDIFKHSKEGEHTLICLDDLQHEVVNSQTMEKLFTQLSHHCCISVLFLNQNLFYQGKYARTLSLNAAYTVLLKNHRNIQQIGILSRQIGKGNLVVEAYKDCIQQPFGYLIVDLHPKTEDDFQLRTNIFSHEQPMVIYKTI